MVSVVPGWVRLIRGSAAIASCTPFSYSSRPRYSSCGRPGAGLAARERPSRRLDSVADHRGLGQPGAEQLGDLVAHRRRTGDQRIGFAHQPRLDRVHLPADRDRTPSPNACRPRSRGWWKPLARRRIRRARSPGGRPASRARARRRAATARSLRRSLQRQPGADHRVAHRQRPRHHVGAEVELVRVLRGGDDPDVLADLVGRRMSARVGAAWDVGDSTTTSWPAAASAVAR